jgi:hypothetical protein
VYATLLLWCRKRDNCNHFTKKIWNVGE